MQRRRNRTKLLHVDMGKVHLLYHSQTCMVRKKTSPSIQESWSRYEIRKRVCVWGGELFFGWVITGRREKEKSV